MSVRLHRFNRRTLMTGAAALAFGSVAGSNAVEAQSVVENTPAPLRDISEYKAYIPAVSKSSQFAGYTCEFDAVWVALRTFGEDLSLADMIDIVGVDRSIEPYYVESSRGMLIYGGDISKHFCGDYEHNFLARSRTRALRPIFKEVGLPVRTVRDQKEIIQCLERDRLIVIKGTVDFQPWTSAYWVTPNNTEYPVVLGNDHAQVIIGYNDDVVVIRDVLGPTSTNWSRPYEYEVPWDQFLACWWAQGNDGQAIGERGSFKG
jgi:hypothetical protein